MGGGPCHWAVEDHLRAGLAVYATPEAAKTFNDDLDWVQREMRVQLVSDDEAASLGGARTSIRMGDLDLNAITRRWRRLAWSRAMMRWPWRCSTMATRRPRSATRSFASTTWPSASRPGAGCWRWVSAARMCRPR